MTTLAVLIALAAGIYIGRRTLPAADLRDVGDDSELDQALDVIDDLAWQLGLARRDPLTGSQFLPRSATAPGPRKDTT